MISVIWEYAPKYPKAYKHWKLKSVHSKKGFHCFKLGSNHRTWEDLVTGDATGAKCKATFLASNAWIHVFSENSLSFSLSLSLPLSFSSSLSPPLSLFVSPKVLRFCFARYHDMNTGFRRWHRPCRRVTIDDNARCAWYSYVCFSLFFSYLHVVNSIIAEIAANRFSSHLNISQIRFVGSSWLLGPHLDLPSLSVSKQYAEFIILCFLPVANASAVIIAILTCCKYTIGVP